MAVQYQHLKFRKIQGILGGNWIVSHRNRGVCIIEWNDLLKDWQIGAVRMLIKPEWQKELMDFIEKLEPKE